MMHDFDLFWGLVKSKGCPMNDRRGHGTYCGTIWESDDHPWTYLGNLVSDKTKWIDFTANSNVNAGWIKVLLIYYSMEGVTHKTMI